MPPIPLPLEHLTNRRFSFYPPIVNVEHNEWHYRKTTWSEILVENTKSSAEIWIPRRFVGEISRIEDPVVIVGLLKELEYKGGAVWPYQRRVLQMPVAVNEGPRGSGAPDNSPAPVIGIRVESSTDSRMLRMVGGTLALGIVICLLVVTVYREGVLRPRVTYTAKDQSYLELTARDDYFAIVRKLGPPAEDRWQTEKGEIQYRVLYYPQRSYSVILMGEVRAAATYVGTLDDNWKPIHYVQMRRGGSTRAILNGLGRF